MFGSTSTIYFIAITQRIFVKLGEEHALVSTDENSDSLDYLLKN